MRARTQEARKADQLQQLERVLARARASLRFRISIGNSTLSITERHGIRLGPGTRSRNRRAARVTSRPPITTEPDVFGISPPTMRSSVVLPQPLGPSSATSSPSLELEARVVERNHRLGAARAEFAGGKDLADVSDRAECHGLLLRCSRDCGGFPIALAHSSAGSRNACRTRMAAPRAQTPSRSSPCTYHVKYLMIFHCQMPMRCLNARQGAGLKGRCCTTGETYAEATDRSWIALAAACVMPARPRRRRSATSSSCSTSSASAGMRRGTSRSARAISKRRD